jgi:hypothetical protein
MPSSVAPRHVDLVSHWRIDAPVDRVWAALNELETWPRWWPCVRSVRLLKVGRADGVGSVRRIEWATRPPCDLVVDVEAVESLRHERLRGRSHGKSPGQLRGEGLWLLRSDGGSTDVTAVWRVELAPRWMRWLAPVLVPLFRWNHRSVMRAGGLGLARHLGVVSRVVC